MRAADPLDAIRAVADSNPGRTGKFVSDLLLDAPSHDCDRMKHLLAERDRMCSDLRQWLQGDRMLVLPVAVDLPFPVDERDSKPDSSTTTFDLLTPSRAISLFGVPALSVPTGRSGDGRPVSVQLVAPSGREDLLLAAANLLESNSEVLR
jgi:amidase